MSEDANISRLYSMRLATSNRSRPDSSTEEEPRGESPPSIGKLAVQGVLWSIVQNWGGKLFTFILFIVLARFLTPADYGTAAAAGLVLMLAQTLAEFGFGDAIIQRRNLQPEDVNLPFYLSVVVTVCLAALIGAFALKIEAWFGVQNLAPVLTVICFVLPLNTLSVFQEIYYRRNLAFKPLALRTFVATLAAGTIAIASAAGGLGVWSIVLQTYVATVISVVWLWRRPYWLPSLKLSRESFIELTRFGLSVVGLRLMDIVSTRLVEFLIIGRYGLAIYGLYTVGSRLYQTLMQLLQSALYDVSLSILSKISEDRSRIAELYQQSVSISAFFASPIFILSAALAPEICAVLFGGKWSGTENIARPLLLLGGLQCVQFLNGPYLSARGRPDRIFIAGLGKAVATTAGLLLIPTEKIENLTIVFVLGQLAATPLSFSFTLSELNLPLLSILRVALPAIIANTVAYCSVSLARSYVAALGIGSIGQGLCLGVLFCAIFILFAGVLGRKQIRLVFDFLKNRLSK